MLQTIPSIFPVLQTEHHTLRQLLASDAQEIWALRTNHIVNQYLNRKPCESLAEAINFIDQVNQNFNHKLSLYWAIAASYNDQLIGTICLFDFSAVTNSCEIGFELLPNYHRQGIMRAAAKEVINFAFDKLAINLIDAFCHHNNTGSIKLLKQLGFETLANGLALEPELHQLRLTK